MKGKTIVAIVASLLALLFVYAAAGQLIYHSSFRLQLAKLPVTVTGSGVLSFVLPLLQLITAVLLLLPARRLKGLIAGMVLLGIFTVYLVAMLGTAAINHCRCGEVWPQVSLPLHIVFNLLLVLLAGAAIVLSGAVSRQASGYA